MPDFVLYIIAGCFFLLLIFLLNFYLNWISYGKKEQALKRAKAAQKKAKASGLLVNCPLCESPLLPGEDLFTRVYRPMNVSDQLCTISGCPHCFPQPEAGVKRECPVCHKEVPVNEGHLVARLFNKTDGKKHVVVSGCNLCCKSKL